MKNIAFFVFILVGLNGTSQDLDKLSKKELKALYLSQVNKSDSIQSLLHLSQSENQKKEITIQKKDSLIKELNTFLVVIEQKLNYLEFESSTCKSSRDSLKTILVSKDNEIQKLNDSIQKAIKKNQEKISSSLSITCSFKEEKIPDCDYPVVVKYCYMNNYKNTRAAMPDFKGNYVNFYELFKKVNGKYVAIKNEDLFGENKNQLLEKIDQKVKQDFNAFLAGPNANECFGVKEAPLLTFDDLAIDFAEDSINFIIKYSMNFSCFSDKGTVVSYSLADIAPYIK